VKQTQAGVSFVTSLDKHDFAYKYKARLQQVLINLLINATKFTTEGSITLTLEKEIRNHSSVHCDRYRMWYPP